MTATAIDTNRVEIRTPDGIVFSLPLAGPVSRFLALAVDWAAVSLATLILGRFLAFFPLAQDVRGAVLTIAWFALGIGYPACLETLWGQTLGKRVLGIRVADASGRRLGFSQVLIRNLLRAVDGLPVFYLVGGATLILGRGMRRLGDIAAGTIVLRTSESDLPKLPPAQGARTNSLRSYRTLAARLRQKTDPVAARIALEALRRRDHLTPQARLAVFREIVAGFRELVEFPEEATIHLTDEQYLWNVVEILFEHSRSR